MAMAGAFDCFPNLHRRQYLYAPPGDAPLIEKAAKYAQTLQQEEAAAQVSLFGGAGGLEVPKPRVVDCEPYSDLEKLKIEKEVTGFYISGHPLDQFKLEIESFCTCTVDRITQYQNKEVAVAGIITKSMERQTNTGKPFALVTIEDYQTSLDMAFFGEDFLSNRHRLSLGEFVYVKGRVEERYNRPGVWELRPQAVQLLTEIREKMTGGIQLTIPLEHLSQNLIERLEALSAEYQGNCPVKVCVHDEQENMTIDMLSRKYRWQPGGQLFGALEELDGVSYQLTGVR